MNDQKEQLLPYEIMRITVTLVGAVLAALAGVAGILGSVAVAGISLGLAALSYVAANMMATATIEELKQQLRECRAAKKSLEDGPEE